ncbi:WXG100 family type VII secretion target [Mycobacterium angelicum]|uniref:WXG100 family type VII secretion target n=1 Tax=Mycobacterium angelicum TaxID=470074 RepID=A0A1W9ZVC1_MYCAN|nr:hypothetical protein [Mycobacterium angelicum]MCV7200184.1 hypothetical protein [Mycobacterium angelicum]ORA21719.1 hypothetical protein BST12_11725 [Mycobacterium angelicum]
MTTPLRVNLADLATSAGQVQDQHAAFVAAHTSSLGQMEAAQPGWIGTSAAALAALIQGWDAEAAILGGRLATDGTGLATTGRALASTDAKNAAPLTTITV